MIEDDERLCEYADRGIDNVLKQIDDCISLLKSEEKALLSEAELYKKNGNEVLERAYRKFANRQKFQIQALTVFRIIFEKWAATDNNKKIISGMPKKIHKLIDLSYF